MTAQHPQTTYEQLQKWYADNQRKLHTPPAFPPAANQAEAEAQREELDHWQLQEKYGKPIDPIFAEAVRFFGWVALVITAIALYLALMPKHSDLDCLPNDVSACFEASANRAAASQKFAWELVLIFGVIFVALQFLAHLVKIAATPERYYNSAVVRRWAKFLRVVGLLIFMWWLDSKIHPRKPVVQPVNQPDLGDILNQPNGTYTMVNAQGFNLQPGEAGPVYLRANRGY